ncbi:MAG: hypothetical protein AABN34_13600 [Acidobacteriota bacterium]
MATLTKNVKGAISVKRYEDVDFEFALLPDESFGGTVLVRGDEMVLDLQDDNDASLYLIVGKPSGPFFEGRNSAGALTPKVHAKWIDFGQRVYRGYWIEDGYEDSFSFRLPRESKGSK